MRKLWSINAIAMELQRDRRTVAKALDGVPPDGKLGRHPAWFLSTALAVLDAKPRRAQPVVLAVKPPKGFEVLEEIENPYDQGAAFMLLTLTYAGQHVAGLLAGVGVPMAIVWNVAKIMPLWILGMGGDIMRQCGMEPFASSEDSDFADLACVEEIDWSAIAAIAGEPVDVEAWKEHGRRLGLVLPAEETETA